MKTIKEYSDILKVAKNIILRGAPGTGKTYLAQSIAANIVTDGMKSDYTKLTDDEKNRLNLYNFIQAMITRILLKV